MQRVFHGIRFILRLVEIACRDDKQFFLYTYHTISAPSTHHNEPRKVNAPHIKSGFSHRFFHDKTSKKCRQSLQQRKLSVSLQRYIRHVPPNEGPTMIHLPKSIYPVYLRMCHQPRGDTCYVLYVSTVCECIRAPHARTHRCGIETNNNKRRYNIIYIHNET